MTNRHLQIAVVTCLTLFLGAVITHAFANPTFAAIPNHAVNYTQNPEQWWNAHPLNPDNTSTGYSIGSIPNPTNVVEVAPDGVCVGGAPGAIQDALDALPAGQTSGYTIQLASGTYCGNFRLVNEYSDTQNGDGSFTQTKNLDGIHFLGDPDGATIIVTTEPYDGSTMEEKVGIYACPEAEVYSTYSNALGTPANPLHAKAKFCANKPIEDIYFKDIIFDGNSTASWMVELHTARSVVFDHVTFRNNNAAVGGSVDHFGFVNGTAILYNIWFRDVTFDQSRQKAAVYMDGLQGGGVVYSRFNTHANNTTDAFMFTNDDFTRDRNMNGTVEHNEYGTTQYAVFAKNVHQGVQKEGFDSIVAMSENSLFKDNITVGRTKNFVALGGKSNVTAQPAGVTPNRVQYEFTGNIIKGNRSLYGTTVASISLVEDGCNPDVKTDTYNADKCAIYGDNHFENNVIYYMSQKVNSSFTFLREAFNATYDADRFLTSTLIGNCANGGQVADGQSPASTGNPLNAISATDACTHSDPFTAVNDANIVLNSSFETPDGDFALNWWNRPQTTRITTDQFTGEASARIYNDGSGSNNNYSFQNYDTGLVSPSTEYIFMARVKPIAIHGSSNASIRYVQNNTQYSTFTSVDTPSSYWRYVIARFTTGASFGGANRIDLAWDLQAGGPTEVLMDDVELFPFSQLGLTIDQPTPHPNPVIPGDDDDDSGSSPQPSQSPSSAGSSDSSSTSSGSNANCPMSYKHCVHFGKESQGDTFVSYSHVPGLQLQVPQSSTSIELFSQARKVTSDMPELTAKDVTLPWSVGHNTVSEIYHLQTYSAFNGYPFTPEGPSTVVLPVDVSKIGVAQESLLRLAVFDSATGRWIINQNPIVFNRDKAEVATVTTRFGYMAVVYPSSMRMTNFSSVADYTQAQNLVNNDVSTTVSSDETMDESDTEDTTQAANDADSSTSGEEQVSNPESVNPSWLQAIGNFVQNVYLTVTGQR